ncbi:TPA: hypothetical protein HA244_00375 [Candidatus Micrarchaeota archaeon]|nr:hypothetical protein [Candidatus Micrarchaeota archaeon]
MRIDYMRNQGKLEAAKHRFERFKQYFWALVVIVVAVIGAVGSKTGFTDPIVIASFALLLFGTVWISLKATELERFMFKLK